MLNFPASPACDAFPPAVWPLLALALAASAEWRRRSGRLTLYAVVLALASAAVSALALVLGLAAHAQVPGTTHVWVLVLLACLLAAAAALLALIGRRPARGAPAAEAGAALSPETTADRERLIGRIAPGLTHEINNSLSAIMTQATLAGRLTDEAKRRDCLDIIQAETERLAAVSRSLSRLGGGDGEAGAPADITEIIGETLALLRYAVRRRQLDVTTELPAGGLRVNAGAVQLGHIVLRLLHYCVRLAEAGSRLHIGLKHPGVYALLEVIVQGEGLDADAPDLMSVRQEARACGGELQVVTLAEREARVLVALLLATGGHADGAAPAS